MLPVKHALLLYIPSQTADPAPPLGTVLGNVGVNTVNFCKDFNAATAALPVFYTVPVRIFVYSNRTYSFTIETPTLSSLMQLLSKSTPTPKGRKGTYRVMAVRQFVLLAL